MGLGKADTHFVVSYVVGVCTFFRPLETQKHEEHFTIIYAVQVYLPALGLYVSRVCADYFVLWCAVGYATIVTVNNSIVCVPNAPLPGAAAGPASADGVNATSAGVSPHYDSP